MKKYLLLVIAFIFFSATKMAAQPTFSIDCPIVVETGASICVPITVADFTNVAQFAHSIHWDNTVLSFVTINVNNDVTGLGLSNFNSINATDGEITVDWEVADVTDCGVTLFPDNQSIYEICFTVIGSYGDFTTISFTDDPVNITTGRAIGTSGNCSHIDYDNGQFMENGCLSVSTPPLIITGNHVSANQDGTACVEFAVENFTNITAVQFTVTWDTNILTHASHSSDILNGGNYGTAFTDDGFLTISYDPTAAGSTLDDGTILFRICFNVIGECNQISSVAITSDKTPIQASNSVGEIGLLQNNGSVTVSCYIPGAVSFCVGNKTVEVGEVFNVPVTVQNFNNIASMVFNMNWDPNQIHYSGTNGYNGDLNIGPSNFNTSQTGSGILSFHWGNLCIPENLPDDTVLFRIQFRASGNPGTSSVSIPNSEGEITIQNGATDCDGTHLLVNNTCSGSITINTPIGITITAPTMSVLVGTDFCIPLTVRDFVEIFRTNYSVLWDPGVIEFVEITNINPTLVAQGFDTGDFDLTNAALGSFCLNWVTFTATSLPSDAVMFDICYKALDNPGNCSPIVIGSEEIGCPTLITNQSSNEENIGLHSYDGNVCVVDEVTFGLSIPTETAIHGETVCLEVLTTDFTQLTTFGFSLNWDETILQLDNVTTTDDVAGFNNTNFDLSAANTGTATASWTSADHPGGGVTLQDSSVLFTLCFTVIGDAPECTNISFGSTPEPIFVNSEIYGTSNIGMTGTNGQVCVEYPFSIQTANISPISCPNTQDGSIDITVVGGTPPYTYFWTTPSGNFSTEDLSNIAEGNCSVTITDSAMPAVQIEATYTIGISTTIPIANAGDDFTKTCSEGNGTEISTITLDGTGSTQEAGYTYLWETNVGGTITNATTLTPTISGDGNFFLSVTETASGCIVRDTVNIQPAIMPTADAGNSEEIVCELVLDGTNSYNTPPLNILWTTLTGNILSGEETLTPTIDKPGAYRLTLTIPTTHCKSSDFVIIAASDETPFADAGIDTTLNCNGDPVLIGGENTSQGAQFTYQWTTIEGGTICDGAPSTESTVSACAVGAYILAVTNNTHNCTKTDTVIVFNGPGSPDINAGIDTALTCIHTEIQLSGEGPVNENFSVNWEATDGGTISAGNTTYSPTITHTGTYTLTVHDIINNCTSTDVVIVTDNTTPPTVSAGADTSITCTHRTINLAGFPVGVGYSHEWSGDCVDCISDINTPFPTVNQGGTFTLTVTDLHNGCTNTAQVTVNVDTMPGTITIAPPGLLTCADTTITLDASGSSGGIDYSYLWTSADGFTITNPTTLTPTVRDSGEFVLTIEDISNGCINSAAVVVDENTIDINVDAGNDITIEDCISSEASFTAVVSPAGDYTIQWTALTGGGSITAGGNSLTPTVDGIGSYEILATNTETACFNRDTIEVKPNDNIQLPDVNAGDDQSIITCTDSTSTLHVTVTQSTDYSIQWYAPTGSIIIGGGDTPNPVVQGFGEFIVEIIDNTTHCPNTDTIEIHNDRTYPSVNAGEDITLTTCGTVTGTPLHGTVSPTSDYTIDWSTSSGNNINNANTLDPTVDGFGLFTLTATNNTTGCSATDEVAVIDGGAGTFEANAGEDITVTSCTETTTVLHGATPTIDNYTVNWVAVNGNNMTNETTLEPTVEGFGLFIMTITNTDTDCTARDTVEVIDGGGGTFEVNAGADISVTSCTETTFTLQGTTPAVENYTVNWTALGSNTITNENSLEPTVEGFGFFVMTITDTDTECSGKDTVEVIDNSTPLEGVSAGADLFITNCGVTEFTLHGSVTSTTDYTVSWAVINTTGQIISGDNTLEPTVSGFDSFEITITDNTTQCRGSDIVQVIDDIVLPNVDAGEDILIECGGSDTVTIVGNGTEGDEVSHLWSTVNGNILTDAGQFTIDAKGTGIYVLTISDLFTNCINADTMEVIVNTSAESATATYVGEDCSSEILLQGNLPENTTGQWTTASTALIDDIAASETAASGLESGTYEFVWTLSTADCPNYSSAVVIYALPVPPTAVDDNFLLPMTETTIDLDLLVNDVVTEDTSKWTFNLLTIPQNGALLPNEERGQYNYTPVTGFSGIETFTYSICLDTCQMLCDTATVNIDVQIDDFHAADIPTGITPNGDGKNDMFVFEMLTDQTVKYPDNEIIIFNRWGDVVYHAKPYLNNWEGTNEAGQPLPHATYYYVLRLDLSKSIIIRGNVTVLK